MRFHDSFLEKDFFCIVTELPLTSLLTQTNVLFPSPADGKGDACEDDYDGDGVVDSVDVCPHNNKISKTSFFDSIQIELDKREQDPFWDYIDVSFGKSFCDSPSSQRSHWCCNKQLFLRKLGTNT